MEISWQQSNWQNSQLNLRQGIVFVVSAVLVYLLLLIPVKFKMVWSSQDPQLSLTLVKERIKPKESIQPTVATPKPVIKPIDKAKYTVEEPIKKTVNQPIKKAIPIEKIIAVKPRLPSAGEILNSIKLSKPLPTVSSDFKQAPEIESDFKPKQWTKPKEKKLIVQDDQIQQMVNLKTTLALKALRTAVGFFIAPMKDAEKTQDHLNYCPTLGRRSVFCPNANPLID